MNQITLLGRMTRDPEIRYTQAGKVVCQFSLAVNRPYTNQEGKQEADFINVVFWGKPAETIGNSFSKGQRILVVGRLQIRSYDDKDGAKKFVTEVIGNSFEFIEKKEGNGNYAGGNTNNGNTNNSYSNNNAGMQSFGNEVPFDENMPF